MNYKCILSVGIRCFTEIFLNEIGYKKFSGPFDGMYCQTVDPLIDILSNGINKDDLLYSEEESKMNELNNKHGYRTLHKKYNFNINDNDYNNFHNALFPHHNLKNEDTVKHFERCFERLKTIEVNKTRILFCLFFHPNYGNDIEVPMNDIKRLEIFLRNKYNCKLLVCNFIHYRNYYYKWKIIYNSDSLIYIHVNNSSHIFQVQKNNLYEIFSFIGIDENELLKYENI